MIDNLYTIHLTGYIHFHQVVRQFGGFLISRFVGERGRSFLWLEPHALHGLIHFLAYRENQDVVLSQGTVFANRLQ